MATPNYPASNQRKSTSSGPGPRLRARNSHPGHWYADLAKEGFAPNVGVPKVDTKYEICSNDECAILSVLNATIFSHLIRKTVDEIEEMVTFGLR
ncbi:hypothetical protein MAHJHV61_50190 [Mycobacterium avium subsp. hominissuis]|uniref:Uncharacterized protein n=1 Tax=Mycobacterium kiyosense TaxID=2871094 RepID=A0AA37PZB5_9MYCO|nr:hypothetical protein SRL2020028_63760 [Mycobacterium kiyosense]